MVYTKTRYDPDPSTWTNPLKTATMKKTPHDRAREMIEKGFPIDEYMFDGEEVVALMVEFASEMWTQGFKDGEAVTLGNLYRYVRSQQIATKQQPEPTEDPKTLGGSNPSSSAEHE